MNRNRRNKHHATYGNAYRYRITNNTPDTITRWAEGLGVVTNSWQQSFLQMMFRFGSLENAAMALHHQPRSVQPNYNFIGIPGPELHGMTGGPAIHDETVAL